MLDPHALSLLCCPICLVEGLAHETIEAHPGLRANGGLILIEGEKT